VADGGRSYFFSGDMGSTLPTLWREVIANSLAPSQAA
jgi:hypothetical protein